MRGDRHIIYITVTGRTAVKKKSFLREARLRRYIGHG